MSKPCPGRMVRRGSPHGLSLSIHVSTPLRVGRVPSGRARTGSRSASHRGMICAWQSGIALKDASRKSPSQFVEVPSDCATRAMHPRRLPWHCPPGQVWSSGCGFDTPRRTRGYSTTERARTEAESTWAWQRRRPEPVEGKTLRGCLVSPFNLTFFYKLVIPRHVLTPQQKTPQLKGVYLGEYFAFVVHGG